LYDAYTHGAFSRAEIGSTLGVSSTSGPFAQRLFSLREYGLIEGEANNFKVSETFKKINSSQQGSAEFKTAAVAAIRKSEAFKELLDAFSSKLPANEIIASRLENQKKFNPDRAKTAARILTESLRYAGVLDGNNNILPVRADLNGGDVDKGDDNSTADEVPDGDLSGEQTISSLSVEIPVGDERKVVIRYPRDMTSDEAQKVGKVLSAIVS
jgi:hypothetical protein